jgi:hypothetical protein
MARSKIEIIRCDICQRPDAQCWRIAPPEGSPVEVDLCVEHAEVLGAALHAGRPARSFRAARFVATKMIAEEPPPPDTPAPAAKKRAPAKKTPAKKAQK